MNDAKLIEKIKLCLSELYNNHQFLFDNIQNCKEETLNHHFANSLAGQFSAYNCDMEYKSSTQSDGSMVIKQASNKNIRPDIIIHKRGYSQVVTDNLVVFECKKTDLLPPNDKEKLSDLTRAGGSNTQQYQFGVAITYWKGRPNDKHAIITIFRNGTQVD